MNPEDDEAARRAEVDRAHRARQILDDALFKEAVQAVKDDTLRMFSDSSLNDDHARLLARLRLDCLDKVVGQLLTHVRTGELAEKQLPLIERAVKAIRR